MVGNLLVIMGERLCEAVDLRAGDRVLDVATGSGNTAISAARRFCEVTAIDYVPELIEQAESRAQAERLDVSFEVGDAEHLTYADASFDVVLSTLGVMFAPDQEKAAGEMLRVCRPGGKIGLANWTPDGFIGNMFRTMGKHVAPPPGIKPPPLWGTEERVRELFGEDISSLEATRKSYAWRYPSAVSVGGIFRRVLPRLLRTDAQGVRVARRGRPGSPGAGPRRVARGLEHLGRRDARRGVRLPGGSGHRALMVLCGAERRSVIYRRDRLAEYAI